jgi:ribosomal protein S18 acetylase RimI-like enzyme
MIRPLIELDAAYIAAHQTMYPEAMREDEQTFRRLIEHRMSWGWFKYRALLGWITFEQESDQDEYPKRAYCYDLAVLQEYQHQGIMKALAKHAYRELRWKSYWIRMHCRKASYPSPGFLFRCGYEIVQDRFIENHYATEYQDDSLMGEHAHELLLKPIGQ